METFLLTFYIVFCTLQQKNIILPRLRGGSYKIVSSWRGCLFLTATKQLPLIFQGELVVIDPLL